MVTEILSKSEMLHTLARNYVLKGLGEKNFDAIPYDEAVELREPICPGGSENPLVGKENLRNQWWAPLPGLIAGVEVLDTYVNTDGSAATVEFYCHITQPKCTLRIIDRFIFNGEGKIIAQENFFDPRAITHPA
jgi:hypothetical protein